MSTASLEWVMKHDYPAQPTPTDVYDFFGIPPSPMAELDGNIREKRKIWKGKSNNARTDAAIARTQAVLQAINEAEDFLKRGAAIDPAHVPSTVDDRAGQVRSIDDLWREIESLLFRGRSRAAVDRLNEFEEQWGTTARYRDLRTTIVLDLLHGGIGIDRDTVTRAIADAQSVIEELGPTEARFLTLIELLDANRQHAEADAAFDHALATLERPSGSFMARRLTIVARQGSWQPILRAAVDLVNADPSDRSLRSEVVQLLVKLAVERLLPLTTAEGVTDYETVIGVAAWAANSVPEAEDFVRPHRMWAANANQPIFAGNWQWRAFFALITGFISLPIQNSIQSRPAWSVVIDGPPDITKDNRRGRARERAWFMATRNLYIEDAHRGVRLPWQPTPDTWIEVEPQFDF